jgi:hypothetical protein
MGATTSVGQQQSGSWSRAFCRRTRRTFRPETLLLSHQPPPGGGYDAVARMIGQKLRARLGWTIIVENRGGANGMIAAEAVAKSRPDGRTVTRQAALSSLTKQVQALASSARAGFRWRITEQKLGSKNRAICIETGPRCGRGALCGRASPEGNVCLHGLSLERGGRQPCTAYDNPNLIRVRRSPFWELPIPPLTGRGYP